MVLTLRELAAIVNDAQRAVHVAHGDPEPPLPWANAPDWQREQAAATVSACLSGLSPQLIHAHWVAGRLRQGWRHGGEFDVIAKEDPLLTDFHRLAPVARHARLAAYALVTALADDLG